MALSVFASFAQVLERLITVPSPLARPTQHAFASQLGNQNRLFVIGFEEQRAFSQFAVLDCFERAAAVGTAFLSEFDLYSPNMISFANPMP